MLYIIGLGLNEKGISQEGLEAVKKCGKVYLENYTVEFPYSVGELEKNIRKKIVPADREFVESCKIVGEAKEKDVGLLVYGSPLSATTHISLIQEAKKKKVECKVIYSGSVFGAVAETGLQLYKFGKIASIPNFEADSFLEVVKDNQKIGAHSLILVDIGLEFEKAIERLKNIETEKIVVCSRLGAGDKKIYYDKIENLKDKKVNSPFCLIVPGKMHFVEEDILKNYA